MKISREILCEILQPLEKVPDGGRGGVGEKFRGGWVWDVKSILNVDMGSLV